MINVTQTFLPPLEEYNAYLKKIWDLKWLTNRGPLALDLEEKLKHCLGVENLLLVNNGTTALQMAIKALGITGEVITTPFSYVATVSSIVWEGCVPVFVDIDPEYLTIDETQIEAAITDKTTAILATHVYGNPCNVEAIGAIAERHHLKVIYDAAHCFGVNYKGESILKWGDVSTLSFHATKLYHTGEGGGITCKDTDLYNRIFYHHNFGHDGPEDFFGLGVNGKMSELNAAMGLAVLPYMEEIITRRREVCDAYDTAFSGSVLGTINLRADTEWNYSYFPVVFESESVLQNVKARLNADGIAPRRYFYPALNSLPYVNRKPMPVAEDLSSRVLCLPVADSYSPETARSIALKILNSI